VFAAAFDWVQIGQSSPWVCDDANVVTVEMRSNQPLLHACHPTVTLSGITGFETKDNRLLSVTNEHDANKTVSTGQWTQLTGELVVKLTDLTATQTSQECSSEACHSWAYRFSFVLQNPHSCVATAPTVRISAEMVGSCGATDKVMLATNKLVQHLPEPAEIQAVTCASKYQAVTFGPAAWHLADNLVLDSGDTYDDTTPGSTLDAAALARRKAKLAELHTKMTFDQCKPPFQRSTASMSMGGASMQFPSHTEESYEAAVRQGSGAIGCQVPFLCFLSLSLSLSLSCSLSLCLSRSLSLSLPPCRISHTRQSCMLDNLPRLRSHTVERFVHMNSSHM